MHLKVHILYYIYWLQNQQDLDMPMPLLVLGCCLGRGVGVVNIDMFYFVNNDAVRSIIGIVYVIGLFNTRRPPLNRFIMVDSQR